jgi:hypothetical protein
MKNSLALPLASILFALSVATGAAGADIPAVPAWQPPDGASRCMRAINDALDKERVLYESVLVGTKMAKDEDLNAVRMDNGGVRWIKVAADRWVTDGQDDSRTDRIMDNNILLDPLASSSSSNSASSVPPGVHPGLLEAQQAVTSDLIPPLLQSFRAFQCRIAAECAGADEALRRASGDSGGPFTAEAPGCVTLPVTLPQDCIASPLFSLNAFTDPALRNYCGSTGDRLVRYQEQQLLMLAHYDGTHRSLRQFVGYIEPLLDVVSFPFLPPLQEAAQFLEEWNRVPCFQPFCATKE